MKEITYIRFECQCINYYFILLYSQFKRQQFLQKNKFRFKMFECLSLCHRKQRNVFRLTSKSLIALWVYYDNYFLPVLRYSPFQICKWCKLNVHSICFQGRYLNYINLLPVNVGWKRNSLKRQNSETLDHLQTCSFTPCFKPRNIKTDFLQRLVWYLMASSLSLCSLTCNLSEQLSGDRVIRGRRPLSTTGNLTLISPVGTSYSNMMGKYAKYHRPKHSRGCKYCINNQLVSSNI